MSHSNASLRRSAGYQALYGMCLALFVGCGAPGSTPIAPPPTSEPSSSLFRGRLEAALLLESRQTRIDAMAKVAQDAAAAGDAEMAREALKHEKMKNVEIDQIVMACSLSLAKVGKVSEGTRLLDLMQDTKERQRVLEQIAKGDFTPR